jgi:hypothetical protein
MAIDGLQSRTRGGTLSIVYCVETFFLMVEHIIIVLDILLSQRFVDIMVSPVYFETENPRSSIRVYRRSELFQL